jgi:ribose transport system substrate-binding protein
MGYLAAAYAIAHLNGVTSIPKLSVTGLAIINNQNISDPAISRLAYVNNLDKPLQPISNYTIGFVAGIEHPYSRKVERGINDLARLLGIKVSARFPQQWNSAVQIPLIEAIATEPINALIAVPVDTDQTTPAFEAVDRQGVPVIHVDTFIGDGNYSNGKVTFPRSYIGSDNEAGGRFACEALARAIGGKGKVYIQNSAQGPALTDLRETGCKNALTHYPDIKLVGVDYNNSDPGRAQAQAAAVLEREKDVSGMYIINDPAVEAVARAVADAGKTGTVRIVAFDSTVGNMASLKAGHISMIVAQKPYDMGFLAAICAVATAHGVDSFPRRMPTDLVLISASNVNEPAIANLAY